MSAEERSNWRDEEISARHRTWGFNVPAVDADFVLVEYDRATPAAIVDYKHRQRSEWTGDRANLAALGKLYGPDGNQLPFIVAQYDPDTWCFMAHPINAAGTASCDQHGLPYGTVVNEDTWVGYLYALRGRKPATGGDS